VSDEKGVLLVAGYHLGDPGRGILGQVHNCLCVLPVCFRCMDMAVTRGPWSFPCPVCDGQMTVVKTVENDRTKLQFSCGCGGGGLDQVDSRSNSP
jgi:hypothetical protein